LSEQRGVRRYVNPYLAPAEIIAAGLHGSDAELELDRL
jgi:glutamine synthetase